MSPLQGLYVVGFTEINPRKSAPSASIRVPSAGVAADTADGYGLHCLNLRESERSAMIRVPSAGALMVVVIP